MYSEFHSAQPQRKINPFTSLQFWLAAILVAFAIVPLIIEDWLDYDQSTAIWRNRGFQELARERDLQAAEIDAFFDNLTTDVVLRSKSPVVIQAARDFSRTENIQTIRASEYVDNPYVLNAGNQTAYDAAHSRYHQFFRDIVESKRYSDIYLILPNGDVIYSFGKGYDFATNILTGPYQDTPLAHLIQDLLSSADTNDVRIAEIALYLPTGWTPMTFIGSPIIQEDRLLGVLVYQLPLSRLDELLKDRASAFGDTGEIYLVGPDRLLRTNSRFSQSETAFKQRVDNEAVEAALKGVSGTATVVGYRGEPTLVAYRPVHIGDQTWALLAEMTESEALAAADELRENILPFRIVTLVMAVVPGVLLTRRFIGPISNLIDVAYVAAAGNLNQQIRVNSRNEIGVLADAINAMIRRMREIIANLEERMTIRTRQMETVLDISHNLAGILDLSDLLRQVVTLTKERFDFYHVHIYLFYEQQNTLVMAEGYGEVGKELKRRGHNIPLNALRSLVARSARERQVVLVDNVNETPDWLPNPLLPDTRSEMAIPILSGTELVGVLDVQSDQVNGVTEEDGPALEALANQVAIAVRNARLFTQTQDALYEAQKLQRLYTGLIWSSSETTPVTEYEVKEPTLPPLQEVKTPEAMMALQKKSTIRLVADEAVESGDGRTGASDNGKTQTQKSPHHQQKQIALATPLKLRDEIIGVLGIHDDDPNRQWTEQEIALIEAVSEQMSLAIENARLFERTERDAWRNRVISETTAHLWASDELESVMQAAVTQLADKLHASEVIIQLGTEADLVQENEDEQNG